MALFFCHLTVVSGLAVDALDCVVFVDFELHCLPTFLRVFNELGSVKVGKILISVCDQNIRS